MNTLLIVIVSLAALGLGFVLGVVAGMNAAESDSEDDQNSHLEA